MREGVNTELWLSRVIIILIRRNQSMDRMNSVINYANTQEAYSICNLVILEINAQAFLSFSTRSI